MKKVASIFAVLLMSGVSVFAGDVDLTDVKCVVAPKNATAGKSADYKDGKVYFCCGGCAGKFAANTKKFAPKANHQLVATKQYKQKACPISGGKLDPSTAIKVAGTDVCFCCTKCKGKVEGEKDEAKQLKMVFGNKAFKKAFEKKATSKG